MHGRKLYKQIDQHMKNILKLISGVLIGIAAGLAIGSLISIIFTDTTPAEYAGKLLSVDTLETVGAALVAIAAFLISIAILIPVHEAGHLVCGLLSGYRFVSFRIFNATIIKEGGKLKIKKFAVAGTGGQCLLTPPDKPLEEIGTGWYNAGGVIANILALLAVIPLFLLDIHPYAFVALCIFCLTDAFMILTNGIPMKLGGIGNDAHNMLHLRHNSKSKRAILLQLKSNALIQEGMRPGDMPEEWFVLPSSIDYKNQLEVSLPLMHASRLVDEMRFEEAYNEFEELYSHRQDIMQLYVSEISCELAFCALMTGRTEEAERLLDDKLKNYVTTYSKVMSSKLRLLCAMSLLLDGDREKAEKIYRGLETEKDSYLLQGEVKSDLYLMRRMLVCSESNPEQFEDERCQQGREQAIDGKAER